MIHQEPLPINIELLFMIRIWIFGFCIAMHFTSCNDPSNEIYKSGLEGQNIPVFTLMLPDSTLESSHIIFKPQEPCLLLIFNPYCPYCRAEINAILNDKDLYRDKIRVCLITRYPFNDMKDFYIQEGLGKYNFLVVGREASNVLVNYYKPAGVPYVAVYDNHSKLKRVFVGKTDIDLIKETIYNH
jgi:thiol-disulfide isomerase/thioredoxin